MGARNANSSITEINSTLSADQHEPSCCCSACVEARAEANQEEGPGIGSFTSVTNPNNDFSGLIGGTRWNLTNVTYSFPANSSFYEPNYDMSLTDTMTALNAAQQAVATYALDQIEGFTNLSFTLVTETPTTDAIMRFGNTLTNTPTAWGYFPGGSDEAGDTWYRTGSYTNPQLGNFAFANGFLHEIGHALGLKHGHESTGFGALATNLDSQEFSVMTYRDHVGDAVDFIEAETGGPQSYMMLDIAALQYLYGADYSSSGNVWSGDSVYTFDPSTGEMFINGVSDGGTPAINRIYRTVWDGHGTDTYDLSNYTTELQIDLRPGLWSTFDTNQLADLDGDGNRATNLAQGNLANALLSNDDTRSLIENAIGGSNSDRIFGNQGANQLEGNGGNDILLGFEGNDRLLGGSGDDELYGDIVPGVFLDLAGGTNTSFVNATSLDGLFTLTSNPDIANSTTQPHVTVSGVGDNNVRYYSFTVVDANSLITLDIDYGYDSGGSFDSWITLYDSSGTQLAFSDDSSVSAGGTGSTSPRDSFLTYTAATPGVYIVAVGSYNNLSPIPAGSNYDLQVSVDGSVLPNGPAQISGNDTLLGGVGADQLFGGAGNDLLIGEAGADILDGGEGNDFASYYNSDARVSIRLDTNVISGGDAQGDTLINIEDVWGSQYDDYLSGDSGDNRLSGYGGNDYLRGNEGADRLDGGSGTDFVSYYNSNARVSIRLDTNVISGGHAEGDRLLNIEEVGGSAYNDYLAGTSGNNKLYGYGGNDYLRGNEGSDRLDGGDGIDLVSYFNSDARVSIRLDTRTYSGGHAEGDRLISIEDVWGSQYDDYLSGNGADNRLYGYDGNDYLRGNYGADLLDGGEGADLVSYFNSTARVSIRLDTNVISGGHAQGDTLVDIEDVWGSQFDDYLAGNSGDNRLYGYGGNDYLRGNDGGDLLDGGAGIDLVSYYNSDARVSIRLNMNTFSGGHADGDTLVSIEDVAGSQYGDYISGNSGKNKLYGLDGDDYLRGIGGNDRLVGSFGNDLLQGGSGNDTFVFKENYDQDTIDDFVAGSDIIELDVNGVNNFGDLNLQTSGSNVRIDFGGGDVLIIRNTTVAALDQDDFSFV